MSRPARAGVAADRGIRIRVTRPELAAIRGWADAQGLTVADAIRLHVLGTIADEVDGDSDTDSISCGDPVITAPTR